MKLAIIGASAGIGLATVKRSLELGHRVNALSRRKIEVAENPDLVTIEGSALNESDLRQVIDGVEVILVTLGTGMNTKATTLYSNFAQLLMSISPNVPVIIVTGFGAGNSRYYLKPMMKPVFRFILNKIYADKTVMENMISKSGIQWEFVRPGVLTNKPLTEVYRVETDLYPRMNIGSISRSDVADYLVKEAVNLKNLGKFVALCHK